MSPTPTCVGDRFEPDLLIYTLFCSVTVCSLSELKLFENTPTSKGDHEFISAIFD